MRPLFTQFDLLDDDRGGLGFDVGCLGAGDEGVGTISIGPDARVTITSRATESGAVSVEVIALGASSRGRRD